MKLDFDLTDLATFVENDDSLQNLDLCSGGTAANQVAIESLLASLGGYVCTSIAESFSALESRWKDRL